MTKYPGQPPALLAALFLASSWSHPASAQDDPCCTESELASCQDGLWCTGEEGCNCWGDCEPGVPRNCDDGNWCTNDYCYNDTITPGTGLGDGHCEHVNVCVNCNVDEDCDDGSACTDEWCASNICFYRDVVCNDLLICTVDTCDPATGCVFTDICADTDVCTVDYCNPAINACSHDPLDCDDADVCTSDWCDSPIVGCQHGPAPGVCAADWQCQIWINDMDPCTDEVCDLGALPCPVCVHVPRPVVNDTCPTASTTTQAGGGASMSWTGSGDLACFTDDYQSAWGDHPASPCGTGVGPDAVWTASLPAEFQLYRYRLEGYDPLVMPADFNPQVCLYYPYRQSALTPVNYGVCGPGADETYAIDDDRVLMCADIGGGVCGLDATDGCTDLFRWHNAAAEVNWPVLPDGSYNLIADTGDGATLGGQYDVRLRRMEAVSNFACDDGDANLGAADSIEPVEVQMGGVWTGNTTDYGFTTFLEGVGYCTQTEMLNDTADVDGDGTCLSVTTPGGCGCDATEWLCFVKEYARAEFRINHRDAPWDRDMGYVISTENPSFDTALSLMGETCQKGCACSLSRAYTASMDGCSGTDAAGCPLACDNNAGTVGANSSKLVTGVLPAGILASVSLHGYYPVSAGAAAQGNYTLKVQYDTDGDGLADLYDPNNALMSGDIYTAATSPDQNGPIEITSLPFHDSRTSDRYAKDLNANPSFCRRYTRDCDFWGCDPWDPCAAGNTTAVDASSRDVFYEFANTGGAGNYRICARPLIDRETWTTVPPYRWDSWALVLMTSTNAGASWNYYYNCEQTAEEEMRCLFEGDSVQTVVAVGAGATLIIGITGVNDSTNADASRAGYYNIKVCRDGTAGCDCGSWDYRP